jgi:hypothetical protein
MQFTSRSIFARVLLFVTLGAWIFRAVADPDHCSICGALYGTQVYTLTDQVAGKKVQACYNCAMSTRRCFLCGLPTDDKFVELPDARVLCSRDAKTAVLDEEKGIQLCRETHEDLDRLFSRFITFPEQNVSAAVVDRVDLQELFKFAGNDFVCPNVWGYLETQTNRGKLEHKLSVMSGLPLTGFKATCAHEYTHAWLNEHLSAARKESLSRDSTEGFCELVSYLLCQSQSEEEALLDIKRNAYTRGQIHLFIDAEQQFGLGDVIDWVQFGVDDRLHTNELARIRDVKMPANSWRTGSGIASADLKPALPSNKLMLNGIIGVRPHAVAMINGRSFAENEQGKIALGKTNVVVRCLEIQRDRVSVLMVGSGEQRELRLSKAAK